jgi:hypothetical protein
MVSEQEEAEYWASQAVSVHRGELDMVRQSATKWQAGIAAFLGVYATVGFVTSPTTLSTLPVSGWIRDLILAGLAVAGAIGIVAVFLALGVAAGLPKANNGQPLTGPFFYAKLKKLAVKENRLLTWAKWLAATAITLVVLSSIGILIGGVIAKPAAPKAILVTSTTTYCGSISTRNGVVSLNVNGKLISVGTDKLKIVTSC